jgi:putative DNA primase/helicase
VCAMCSAALDPTQATPDRDALLKKAADFAQNATKPLSNNSDVDMARHAAANLRAAFSDLIVYCEGAFLFYNGKCWAAVTEPDLRSLIHRYDGMKVGSIIKLGKQRINSILYELGAMLATTDWFTEIRVGINCLNGFIEFDREGKPSLLPHDPSHRQRHVLPAEWRGPVGGFEGSLLERLLVGCFRNDSDANEKIDLLGEVAGAAALGYGTRLIAPKAVVLLGREAENGKSQILDLLRGMLPASAVASVPPNKFADERHTIKLVGKLLNTSDELGTARAIGSDVFKSLVTGEPVSARDVYASAVDFRATAQHVFACNQLPAFQGGMDRGVLRRLIVLLFNRTIPETERIPHIGMRILEQETGVALSFVVAGASRLIRRQAFPELQSSKAALMEWAREADPVQGWLAERVVKGEGLEMPTNKAYTDFRCWALTQGYSEYHLPAVNTFSQRLKAAGLHYDHSGKFRGFRGVRVKELGEV